MSAESIGKAEELHHGIVVRRFSSGWARWTGSRPKLTMPRGVAKLAVAYAIASPALAHPVTLPAPLDLRNEAALVRREGKPLVVLFSLPGCPYCKEVRENYLVPLVRDVALKDGALIREIDVTSNTQMRDFEGHPLSQHDFSARYKVRVTPTVLMFDAGGTLLADPLVGSGMAGFYGAYLDNALSQSTRKLKQGMPPP
jgi:thiol-disulfide isomerase/thioredoxin